MSKIVVDHDKLVELLSEVLYQRAVETDKRAALEKQQALANAAEKELWDYMRNAPKAEEKA